MFHLIPHIKSAYQIRSYVRFGNKKRNVFKFKHWDLHCSWSDKTALSPKKILNVDLSLLKCTEFFHRFQNKNLFEILG